jgi:hypothetical protein
MNTPTRPATPDDERPIEHPALRPPRLPTFFADPITGLPTMLPTDDDEDSGIYIPTVDDNDETEAEWLDRRLGW